VPPDGTPTGRESNRNSQADKNELCVFTVELIGLLGDDIGASKSCGD